MKYDLIVIGGGPAGIMTAGRAGELGSRVLLIEKNKFLGKKLLLTGKGRCNFTNKKSNIREFIDQIGPNGKFLFSALSLFGPNEIISFFEKRGVKSKIENEGKVFPTSDRAKDILDALDVYLKKSKVEIRLESEVKSIIIKDKTIQKIILSDNQEFEASNFVITTGGKSYFKTGSTGDGFKWAKKLGHTIITPIPILTSLILKTKYSEKLEGLSLREVRISIYNNKKKIVSETGDVVFTENGISGPIILNISRKIGRHILDGFKLNIDLYPNKSLEEFDLYLQNYFIQNGKKLFRNSIEGLVPPKMIPVILKISQISPTQKTSFLTKEERKKIISLLKNFELTIHSLAGFDQSIVTSGGIDLKEVNQKTMKSKIIDNLYFAGEILDLDGPTGGYNLQICWSTGYVAGQSVGTVQK